MAGTGVCLWIEDGDMTFYLIGSLRNPNIPTIANQLEAATGFEIFADWYAPGPNADLHWKEYEKARGRTYNEALQGWAAKHIFEFDKFHLDRADGAILILPCGVSGHLEAGYMAKTKPVYALMDQEDHERWDVMRQFSTVCFSMDELSTKLIQSKPKQSTHKALYDYYDYIEDHMLNLPYRLGLCDKRKV